MSRQRYYARGRRFQPALAKAHGCPSSSNRLKRWRGDSSARNCPDRGNSRLGRPWRRALPMPFRWPCANRVLLRTRAQHARAPGSGPGVGLQVLRSAGAFSGNARAHESAAPRAPAWSRARRPAAASAIVDVVRSCLGAASELDRPAALRRSLISQDLLSSDLSLHDDA